MRTSLGEPQVRKVTSVLSQTDLSSLSLKWRNDRLGDTVSTPATESGVIPCCDVGTVTTPISDSDKQKMRDAATQTEQTDFMGGVMRQQSPLPEIRTENNTDDSGEHLALLRIKSQATLLGDNPLDPWERRKKIAFCIYSTLIAVLVGAQFGLLSIEDYFRGVPLAASYFVYRFFSSFIVNAMGSTTTTFDAIELFKKLKKDANTHSRDLAVVGPFIPAVALMVFAVISTIPLAKDSTEGLFGANGVVTQKLGLSDVARTAIQFICIAIWCIGYTAPTRLDTGYAIMRELYEDILMSRFQPDRHTQVMLVRDLKEFKTNVFVGDTDSVLTLEKITQFYSAVHLILQSRAESHSCLPSMDMGLKLARRILILACLPIMTPVLQDTSERAMSELMGFLYGVTRITLAAVATLAALIFFVRSSQLLPARMVQMFKGVYGSCIDKGCGPVIAATSAMFYTSLLIAIGVGSSFGWVFEAKNFREGSSFYNRFTFSGYEYLAGGYGGSANVGFAASYTNAILELMRKYSLSVWWAIFQRSFGVCKLQDTRSDDVVAADERSKKLSKGTGLASDVSLQTVRALRERAFNRSALFITPENESAVESPESPIIHTNYGSLNIDTVSTAEFRLN